MNTLESVWARAARNHESYSATGDLEHDIRFFALALTGEAGEVANLVKKRWRDGIPHLDELRKEVADVFAYNIMLAGSLGMTPQDLLDTVALKQDVFIDKMLEMGRRPRCQHCGKAYEEGGSILCAPPFERRPHAFTGNHPADRSRTNG